MDPLKVAIPGVSGRMGQMLVRSVAADQRFALCGALERADAPWIGADLGVVMGGQEIGLKVTANADEAFAMADVVIDFTLPSATAQLVDKTAALGVAHVIGTTGFDGDQLGKIQAASAHIPILRAGNMSVGVNLLTKLTTQVARALDVDFDIEIVEAHHNKKVDAPSGTALMFGEAAALGRKVALSEVSDSGRDGITGARKIGDIGFSAIRGGDIVGEHDVIFAGQGERIILRHVATDRALFARGALRAALWLKKQAPGAYDMQDVLDL